MEQGGSILWLCLSGLDRCLATIKCKSLGAAESGLFYFARIGPDSGNRIKLIGDNRENEFLGT